MLSIGYSKEERASERFQAELAHDHPSVQEWYKELRRAEAAAEAKGDKEAAHTLAVYSIFVVEQSMLSDGMISYAQKLGANLQ